MVVIVGTSTICIEGSASYNQLDTQDDKSGVPYKMCIMERKFVEITLEKKKIVKHIEYRFLKGSSSRPWFGEM